MSRGSTADIDPQFWSIRDGRLYLNLNEKVNKLWLDGMAEKIKEADRNWPAVIEK